MKERGGRRERERERHCNWANKAIKYNVILCYVTSCAISARGQYIYTHNGRKKCEWRKLYKHTCSFQKIIFISTLVFFLYLFSFSYGYEKNYIRVCVFVFMRAHKKKWISKIRLKIRQNILLLSQREEFLLLFDEYNSKHSTCGTSLESHGIQSILFPSGFKRILVVRILLWKRNYTHEERLPFLRGILVEQHFNTPSAAILKFLIHIYRCLLVR